MVEALTGFARALRDAGVPVSVAEVLDSARALRAAGIEERETFRLALRACTVKAAEQQPTFDRLFEAHFHVPWPRGEAPEKRKRRRDQPASEGRRPGPQKPNPLPSPTEQPGQGPREEPEAPQEPRRPREAAKRLREDLEHARHTARARARQETERRRQADPRRRPLWQRMSREDVDTLDREVERLGRLLRTRHGRRFRQARYGRPDLRATIAAGVRTGGVPFRLIRRRRQVLKPRLLVLCDVSGSVIRTARFLLRLLHETHRLFDRTTGFVFVDRPVPAAPLFRAADFAEGLAQLEALPGLDLHALSDFGHVFLSVLNEHSELLTRRTTVLVLGDARCNRFDPQVWALEAIARRVSRVVWLNPERRDRWYTADSRLREYEPWLDALLPAETLDDLAAGITRLAKQTS